MDLIAQSLPFLLGGAAQTLKITLIAEFFGCILGLIIAMGRLSRCKWVSSLATAYVDFFRGTPLLVQVFIVYFGVPELLSGGQTYLATQFGIAPLIHNNAIPPFLAAAIACSINSGAYVAEIFRAGIQSIDKGQMEAARSLGMTHGQAMRYVILPQAFKRVVPPLGNEFIALLKDTSLLAVIGYVELTRRGQLVIAATFRSFEIWVLVALIYLAMTFSISRLVDYTERKLKTGNDQG